MSLRFCARRAVPVAESVISLGRMSIRLASRHSPRSTITAQVCYVDWPASSSQRTCWQSERTVGSRGDMLLRNRPRLGAAIGLGQKTLAYLPEEGTPMGYRACDRPTGTRETTPGGIFGAGFHNPAILWL